MQGLLDAWQDNPEDVLVNAALADAYEEQDNELVARAYRMLAEGKAAIFDASALVGTTEFFSPIDLLVRGEGSNHDGADHVKLYPEPEVLAALFSRYNMKLTTFLPCSRATFLTVHEAFSALCIGLESGRIKDVRG